MDFKDGSAFLKDKADRIINEMANLETRIGDQEYKAIFKRSLVTQQNKVTNSDKTPSGKLLEEITSSGMTWDEYTDQVAKNHKEEILKLNREVSYLEKQARDSLEEFRRKESEEEKDFDSFLAEYLSAIE